MTATGLVEAFDALFSGVSAQTAAPDTEGGWSAAAWKRLADAGVPWVSVPEASGGSGGSLTDAYDLLHLAGRHATPFPLAETGPLAGWLLSSVGAQVPRAPLSVAPGLDVDDVRLTRVDGFWRLTGSAHRVPWSRAAALILLVLPFDGTDHLVMVPTGLAEVHAGRNLAGEPRDRLVFDTTTLARDAVVPLPDGADRAELHRRGAVCRSVMMVGALERVADLTVRYAGVRQQFGRPIARFQAVAQNLALIAEHAERARLAVSVSASMAARHGHDLPTAARAKVLACEAARLVSALAHQVHGAIGMTEEYPLGLYTSRLWSWTAEYGSDAIWARRLGEQVVRGRADALWPLVTTCLHTQVEDMELES